MPTETASGGTILAPDEAFAALGNETRMAILQALWDSRDPLSFSDLRDAIGIQDPGRFHYHLSHLTDHFVRKSGKGYVLRAAGNTSFGPSWQGR